MPNFDKKIDYERLYAGLIDRIEETIVSHDTTPKPLSPEPYIAPLGHIAFMGDFEQSD